MTPTDHRVLELFGSMEHDLRTAKTVFQLHGAIDVATIKSVRRMTGQLLDLAHVSRDDDPPAR